MGRGEGWVEVPFILPVGSVNGYVVSWVASQDGFSRILELRFQKVIAGLRLLSSSQIFSSCFITLLHLPTLQQFFSICHTGEQSSSRELIGKFGINSRTCINRSVVKVPIFFLLCTVTFSLVMPVRRFVPGSQREFDQDPRADKNGQAKLNEIRFCRCSTNSMFHSYLTFHFR